MDMNQNNGRVNMIILGKKNYKALMDMLSPIPELATHTIQYRFLPFIYKVKIVYCGK